MNDTPENQAAEGAAPAEAPPQDDQAKHNLNLEDLGAATPGTSAGEAGLEAVYDVPVKVKAVLGSADMYINQLLKLGRGAVVELDRRVGDAVDIYVNDRLVARGEVVIVEDRLGVTMTEIIKSSN
jgi:flagellar motor switch protein FliN/FliY